MPSVCYYWVCDTCRYNYNTPYPIVHTVSYPLVIWLLFNSGRYGVYTDVHVHVRTIRHSALPADWMLNILKLFDISIYRYCNKPVPVLCSFRGSFELKDSCWWSRIASRIASFFSTPLTTQKREVLFTLTCQNESYHACLLAL